MIFKTNYPKIKITIIIITAFKNNSIFFIKYQRFIQFFKSLIVKTNLYARKSTIDKDEARVYNFNDIFNLNFILF